MDRRDGVPLTGGDVNLVVRVGDTVRRPTGEHTPAVHALLEHLEHKGVPHTPRVLGFDEHGREILSYIEGTPALYPLEHWARTDEALEALAHMLRKIHDATLDFVSHRTLTGRHSSAPQEPAARSSATPTSSHPTSSSKTNSPSP